MNMALSISEGEFEAFEAYTEAKWGNGSPYYAITEVHDVWEILDLARVRVGRNVPDLRGIEVIDVGQDRIGEWLVVSVKVNEDFFLATAPLAIEEFGGANWQPMGKVAVHVLKVLVDYRNMLTAFLAQGVR